MDPITQSVDYNNNNINITLQWKWIHRVCVEGGYKVHTQKKMMMIRNVSVIIWRLWLRRRPPQQIVKTWQICPWTTTTTRWIVDGVWTGLGTGWRLWTAVPVMKNGLFGNRQSHLLRAETRFVRDATRSFWRLWSSHFVSFPVPQLRCPWRDVEWKWSIALLRVARITHLSWTT